jgi:hypothetical protein
VQQNEKDDYMNQFEYENGVAQLPLSDGTFALLTPKALGRLEDEFGIVEARVKKGAAGCNAVVARISTGDFRTNKEIPVRDLLATWVYFPSWHPNENRGRSYFLTDGDARNLMPGNFLLTDAPTVVNFEEKKPRVKKVSAPRVRPTDALPIETQEALLEEAFPKMRGIATAILRPESTAQGEEVCQTTALELLQQIRAGGCDSINKWQFFAWAFSAVKTVALRKLRNIQSGVCKDVDHDRAAIRLLRVKRLNGKMREQAGLSLELDENMLGDINLPSLARQLETEAAEKAEAQRQQKADGGSWRKVDIEAAAEVEDEPIREPEVSATDEDDYPDNNGDQRADFDREDFRQRLTEAA